ncbi:MAG: hypothetical protein JSR39_02050 [Verrucomicrobia bacterium]|nr:hypothetical protein [Verrucomicrobiota bacterium]
MVKYRRSKKKQTFLLLELLIALSLFTLCVLPLIQIPFNALSSEIKSCQRMQLQRLADLTFAEIEAQLFQNQISWDDLSCKRREKTQVVKDVQAVQLKGIGKRDFERTCSIWTSRLKQGKNQDQHRLLTIELEYRSLNDPHFFLTKKSSTDKTVFRHQVYVSKIPASSVNAG